MGEAWDDGLLAAGLGDPAIAGLVGWPARVGRMAEVEGALARALAKAELIPEAAAEAISQACDVARLDLRDLAVRAAASATPVIPLLRALSEDAGELVSSWLHHGATSQDIVDTATVLQLRAALDVLDERLLAVTGRCASLADEHRGTVLAGRTLGQHAVPVTFGLKAARWLGALDRRIEQLRWLLPRVLVVQLGGAAGTCAAWGQAGLAVAQALADELGLDVPDLPWHAERDRIVELAGWLASVSTTVEHIAADLVLLAQTEIGEVREAGPDAPTSSAMPHKRNPVHATAARAAARLATGEAGVLIAAAGGHEHERAAGAWQAEWVALPSCLVRTGGALRRLEDALDGLHVDEQRARANITAHLGLVGSEALSAVLTGALGRGAAHELVADLAARAGADGVALRDVAAADVRVTAVLPGADLDAVLALESSLRLVPSLIDRALAAHDRLRTAP